jgi:hypothetical protein
LPPRFCCSSLLCSCLAFSFLLYVACGIFFAVCCVRRGQERAMDSLGKIAEILLFNTDKQFLL